MQPADPKPADRVAPPPSIGGAADDLTALAALVREHQRPLWRYLRLLGADAHEADDLMQDAFVIAAERLRAGERLASPAAYLRGVGRNLLLVARRREGRRPPEVPWIDAVDAVVADEPALLEDDRLDQLRACLDRLSGRMREAVELHHLQGESCRDVAQRLGIGANGIKSLLSRARRALRECIEAQTEQETS